MVVVVVVVVMVVVVQAVAALYPMHNPDPPGEPGLLRRHGGGAVGAPGLGLARGLHGRPRPGRRRAQLQERGAPHQDGPVDRPGTAVAGRPPGPGAERSGRRGIARKY